MGKTWRRRAGIEVDATEKGTMGTGSIGKEALGFDRSSFWAQGKLEHQGMFSTLDLHIILSSSFSPVLRRVADCML